MVNKTFTKTVGGRTWHYSHSIGHHVGPNGFANPCPVVHGPDNLLYVGNTGLTENHKGPNPILNPRITKLTIEQEPLAQFGYGDLVWPQGLAVDTSGNIYCSDAHSHFVIVYDSEGNILDRWGQKGSGQGEFNAPSGLSFDKDGSLWVVDSGNHRVQKFTVDGKYISEWGSHGSAPGQLDQPWGITIDKHGDVYVVDWGNNRVQKFTQDGTYIMTFGSDIDDGGQLSRPSDVAVDSEGDVYVVDWGNNRVQVYYSDGDIITGLYGDAHVFSESAQEVMDTNADYQQAFRRVTPHDLVQLGLFERPRGIAIDEADRIVVTDCIRGRLQVYVKDKEHVPPQFNL